MRSTFVSRFLQVGIGSFFAVAGTGFAAEPELRRNLPKDYVEEAPLPEGFPTPSPPGEIVEKSYPVSRTYSAEGKNAFFKCFSYLTLKGHEMTAPVVMDYAGGVTTGKSPQQDADRMHFILERPTLDKPGKKVLVEVADVAKTEVVSIAMQGELTAEKLQASEEKLRKYVSGKPGLKVAGDLRVLGYNSPSVRPEKRFWEVQLPVGSATK